MNKDFILKILKLLPKDKPFVIGEFFAILQDSFPCTISDYILAIISLKTNGWLEDVGLKENKCTEKTKTLFADGKENEFSV